MSPEAPGETQERKLLEAARGGDESAFQQLVEPMRGELSAHCYRMLGSVHDAEDALQDALLRAWRGLARFEGRSSLRSWLYSIATNTSLDLIHKRTRRGLPVDLVEATEGVPGAPISESQLIDPFPADQAGLADGPAAPEASYEQRESVELAFTAALQLLPPRQRAVLILREVLGFSAREVAASLETSVASVNSALQRARRTIDDALPEQSQQQTLRGLGDDRARQVVEAYMDAMERGDVDAVVSLLARDAAWSMPPLSSWYRGADSIAAWLAASPLNGTWTWRYVRGAASGQLAAANYTWHESEGRFLPFCVNVLTLDREARITDVVSFIARPTDLEDPRDYERYPSTPPDPGKVELLYERFGLPAALD